MSANNSESLQDMLSSSGVFTGKDTETQYAPFDIHCEAAGYEGLNAYKSHCEIRVVTEDSNEDCRVCEYGKKVAQRLNFSFLDIGKCPNCGQDNDGIHKTCARCLATKQRYIDRVGKDEINRQNRASAKLRRERKLKGG